MKKILLFLLVLMMGFAFVSCGQSGEGGGENNPPVVTDPLANYSVQLSQSAEYDGTAKSVTYPALPSGYTMEVLGDEMINPGTYTITLNVKDSSKVTKKTFTVTFTITGELPPADPLASYSVQLTQSAEYDGTAKSVSYPALPSGYTMEVSGDEMVDPGTYSVVLNVKDSSKVTKKSFTVTFTITGEKPQDPLPDQDPGKISLDSDCYRSSSDLTYTLTYGDYDFELSNVGEFDSGYLSIYKGGYVLNTTAFGDIDSFIVEYSTASLGKNQVQADLGFGSLYYVTDSHAITNPRSYTRNEVTNNTLITLEDNPNYIAFYSFNKINIKSITINYNQTATYTETYSDFNVTLFASNDIHGQVNADDSHAGLTNVTGFIEDQKTKYNILLDQGDIYQGSLACYLTEGHIMDDYLLTSGFESTILGNHEWDWMEPNILEHREYSPEVKLLACNVRYKDGSTPDWVRNYYITERGGVKFGVIGALGDIAGDISADMIENIMFVTGNELTNMISGFADELKAAGCDYIILQIHAGSNYSGTNLDTRDPGYTEVDYSKLKDKLNIVLESHSHRAYYHYDNYGILHIQCGGYLSALGKITLAVTWSNNKPSISIKNVYIANATKLKQYNSKFFADINDWYSANVYKEESERVVATLDNGLTKDQIEQMQAEAYLNLKNIYSELKDYDVAVAGGHIGARSPQKLNAGNVTMSDVTNLFPFDNEMYLVKIKGNDLKYGFLKDTNKLAGTLNADSKTNFNDYYYIIIDSYNYFYLTKQRNYTSLSIIVNLTELYGVHPRDAFEKYLGSQYPIKEEVQEYTFEINSETFDYSASEKSMTVDGVTVNFSYSGLAANGKYPQFYFNNNGYITATCQNGYVISGIVCQQYSQSNYENIHFFSDLDGQNAITYSYDKTSYTMTNNTSGVKLTSTYNTKIVKITFTVTKAENK